MISEATPATILLVEDDLSLLTGISDLLEVAIMDYDVTVLQATNGTEGLKVLEDQLPALIISDIAMPKMDGYQFLRQVRQNPNWVHIPFIFLTARGTQAEVRTGRESGAEHYIVKPFDLVKLAELVKAQLDRGRQLSEARDKQLDRLKHSILQVLNHEFRTPLSLVTAYHEMLAASLTGGTQEPIQEYLSGIQKGCDRLSLLVNGLIMVIELRTGEMLSRFEQQARVLGNLGEIWARAGQQQMAQAAKDEVTLEINVPDDLPPAYGMEEAIGIIAEQLIDNAIKFCTPESIVTRQVTLSARADDDSIYLEVSDTGIGIPDDVIGIVFDLFYQHDRDRYEQQGAGIGLTISQELARLHGGRIDVVSHSGIGSTFTFVIPRRESRPPLSPGVEAKLKRLSTVLVVEDDPYLREGLCDLIELTEKPFDLRTINASNGAHALQVMAETRPDLIISDIMMPVMDGYEFLRKVRSNPDWVQIPFVFLTAKGEEKDIHRGLQMGVEEYITKPYNSDVIMSMVAVLLRRYYQVQDVLQRNFSSFKRSILGLLTPKVREPLDSVTQYSAQVANELGTASSEIELKHSLQGLQASSQQLFRIVEDFILLAEIKTGEALVAFSYQAMVISPTHEFFQQLFMQHDPMHELDVHVHVEQFPTLPGIYGDPSALEKIVQLLLSASTAICNEYEQNTIYVSASHNEGKIWISVECSNIHLPTHVVSSLERLFDAGDEALLTEVEYGAAIAVVNGLLGLHSGSVKIDNEAHGGCTFTIFLPVHQE